MRTPLLVIVTGMPAAGKTTLAAGLSLADPVVGVEARPAGQL
jgi:dephospho-CoA kinase